VKQTSQCIEYMISRQHSVLLQAGRLGQSAHLDIEGGIRLASGRNNRSESAEYGKVRGRVRGDIRSGHYALRQVARGYSRASRRWSKCASGRLGKLQNMGLRGFLLSVFENTKTNEGVTTTQFKFTQMHDIVKTLPVRRTRKRRRDPMKWGPVPVAEGRA